MPTLLHRLPRPIRGCFALTIFLLLWTGGASAQFSDLSKTPKAAGILVWYGLGRYSVDGAPGSASNEVKGYSEILPRNIDGAGPDIAFSFKSWGLNIGYTSFDVNLKSKQADVNQTPANTADDVTVRSLHMAVTSLAIVYQPARWFYLGYGKNLATLEFRQVSATGQNQTKRISIDNPFYAVGVAVGFDPTKRQVAPVVAVFARIPAEHRPFSGSTVGIGVGLYF